jgi:hypothetical protein
MRPLYRCNTCGTLRYAGQGQLQGGTSVPTALPRVNVPFDKATYEALQKISETQQSSLSHVVAKLVVSALEFSEDISLAEVAHERMITFNRDEALTSQDILKWNKRRTVKRR